MNLRKILDKIGKPFISGKLKKFYPIYDLIDTIMYTPLHITKGLVHVRDAMDYKRMMLIVIYSLIPVIMFSLYNTGYQANLAIVSGNGQAIGWIASLMGAFGLTLDPSNFISNIFYGLLVYIPIITVTMVVGGFWEVVFGVVNGHEINEGFLVTGMLFPLVVSPTVPLWQVALAISFGVVVGKEIFGGTGMNIFNPALLARAFLFFAYPADISGEQAWIALDGVSQATPLLKLVTEVGYTSQNIGEVLQLSGGSNDIYRDMDPWLRSFIGLIPGSIGETSTFAIIMGAILLICTRIASWRIIIGGILGLVVATLIMNMIADSLDNSMMQVPFKWHLVLGGFAFGLTFMATDPVSAASTNLGRWIYSFLIGFLCVLIRVVNPAYPEGMMLVILLMNGFAPIIDYYVVQGNIKRRRLRNAR